MSLIDEAASFFQDLQHEITTALERLDGGATFREDLWERAGGGGGRTRVLEGGALLEKAGVNWSDVHGEFSEEMAANIPGTGRAFRASGVSLVLHPRSPMVPTVHANFRVIEKGDRRWFGGGADLTPYYPFADDVVHFHATFKEACDLHDASYYPKFKKWCDEYFFLPHRGETRGVGGLFYDYVDATEASFPWVRDVARSFLPAYLPIAERRREEHYGEAEREFQLYRRGRYVEFNLLYDRGTTFGLKTGGRIESILMSLPPLARWVYDFRPPPGSREEALTKEWLRPRDWLGGDLP